LTESMSLPDPKKLPSIMQFAERERISADPQSIPQIYGRLKQLSDADLIAYTDRLQRFYESILADVGGDTSNSPEKVEFISELLSVDVDFVLNGTGHPR